MESLSGTLQKALQRETNATCSCLSHLVALGAWVARQREPGSLMSPMNNGTNTGLPTPELLVNVRKTHSSLVKPLPFDLCFCSRTLSYTQVILIPCRLRNQVQKCHCFEVVNVTFKSRPMQNEAG